MTSTTEPAVRSSFSSSSVTRLLFCTAQRCGPLATMPSTMGTLTLHGPAAETSPDFGLNGIAAVRHGDTLVVAHSANGELYTVDPATGESAMIADVSVPGVDGIVLQGRRLWAVQGFSNQITELRLTGGLTAGTVTQVITDPLFQVPSTAIRFHSQLAVVNAKFDTGFPPTADQYEVVIVDD